MTRQIQHSQGMQSPVTEDNLLLEQSVPVLQDLSPGAAQKSAVDVLLLVCLCQWGRD